MRVKIHIWIADWMQKCPRMTMNFFQQELKKLKIVACKANKMRVLKFLTMTLSGVEVKVINSVFIKFFKEFHLNISQLLYEHKFE